MGRRTDDEVLLGFVPVNGETIGNVSLLRQLEQHGWSEEKFWRIRDRLLSEGVLIRGRGKGGSVRRAESSEPASSPASVEAQPKARLELALYEPLLEVLRNDWRRVMQIEPEHIHFEISAHLGRKATGGIWTRPDIVAVSVRTFQHLPGRYADIWTFEVKALNAMNVLAIFEAAAHSSRATRSYALMQVPQCLNDAEKETLDRCEREADRLRVGLITFSEMSDFSTWDLRVDAPRIDTAPEALEELITQLSDEAKKRLARWK